MSPLEWHQPDSTISQAGTTNGYNSIAFANCRGGDTLWVRLNSDFDLLTPLVGQFLGNPGILRPGDRDGQLMALHNQTRHCFRKEASAMLPSKSRDNERGESTSSLPVA